MSILEERINHIVVLMLENRSFDCLFGKLYPKAAGFNGLTGTESNLDMGGTPTGWRKVDPSASTATVCVYPRF